jgi:hypothetical protein
MTRDIPVRAAHLPLRASICPSPSPRATASRQVMMATQIPERPGSFREFVAAATDPLAGGDVSVTEFKYRYSAGQVGGSGRGRERVVCVAVSVACCVFAYARSWGRCLVWGAHAPFDPGHALAAAPHPHNPPTPPPPPPPKVANILWSAGVPGKAAAAALVERVNGAGMPTVDISDIDAAQARATGGGVAAGPPRGAALPCVPPPHPAAAPSPVRLGRLLRALRGQPRARTWQPSGRPRVPPAHPAAPAPPPSNRSTCATWWVAGRAPTPGSSPLSGFSRCGGGGGGAVWEGGRFGCLPHSRRCTPLSCQPRFPVGRSPARRRALPRPSPPAPRPRRSSAPSAPGRCGSSWTCCPRGGT